MDDDKWGKWNEHWGAWLIKETETHEIFVMPFIYTHAIVTVPRGHYLTYEDRWCYMTKASALYAAVCWDGAPGTEPEGWHRHPVTGRRRENGEPSTETIQM
jgi:hypothetical protein